MVEAHFIEVLTGDLRLKRRVSRNLKEVRVLSQALPALSTPAHSGATQVLHAPGAGGLAPDPLRFSPQKSPGVLFHPRARITFPLPLKQTSSLRPFQRGSFNSV